MLSREENELLTRVGPGTAMGETMRRYWIPALLVREIAEPDGPPVRVRLLGEDLVAFRDSDGRIGLLDEYCSHRRASLFFGRNEECGLRCVYHGWKFAVDGSCVDQMNEPEENQFKHKVRVTAYPTCELGGLVWAYMGPAEKIPPLPKFAWTQAPETHRHVSKVIQECNWGDAGHAWVPIDDETTMVYNWVYTRKSAPLSEEDRLERAIGNGPEHVDQTTFRSKANRDNAYLIDRAVQKTETFTGIDGINVQDRAIQESMGAICDRSQEHLGPADKGIIQMRRLLREAIKTVRAGGTPAGVAPSYYDLYCALQVLPRDADWRRILSPDIVPEKILQTV